MTHVALPLYEGLLCELAVEMILQEWVCRQEKRRRVWCDIVRVVLKKGFLRVDAWRGLNNNFSSLLLGVGEYLSCIVRVLRLERRRTWIKGGGLQNTAHLLLLFQRWVRWGVLREWPWLFDKALLDILIYMKLCRSLFLTDRRGQHRLKKLQLLGIHGALFLLLSHEPHCPALPAFLLIADQELHQSVNILVFVMIFMIIQSRLLSWCHYIVFIV